MKVLFLDCDGVINCSETFRKPHDSHFPVEPYMAFLVGKIQLDTDCKVVLSSSWRHHDRSIDYINKRIVPLLDVTGNSWYDKENEHHSWRGEEIKVWLDKHPEVTKYAILDDDSDMLDEQLPNFFKTYWSTGLTKEIADKVIEHLNL